MAGSNWLGKIWRLVVYFLTGVIPFLVFFVGIAIIRDVNLSALFAIIAAIVMTFVSNWFSSSPWVRVMEGNELLCLNLSGGNIEAYTLKVELPYAIGKIAGKVRKIFFDRAAVWYLLGPKPGELKEDAKTINITLDKSQLNVNMARHDFSGITTFIYDEQLGNFITKDFINDKEQSLFLKNQAFSVHNQLQEVKNDLHFYARYVNQKLFEKTFMGMDMKWLIIAGFVLIAIVIFGPNIINLINSVIGKGAAGISGATAPISVKP